MSLIQMFPADIIPDDATYTGYTGATKMAKRNTPGPQRWSFYNKFSLF